MQLPYVMQRPGSNVACVLMTSCVSLCLLQRTVTAMAKVGIPPEQRDSVFATVAAVLHLGNVSFVDGKESDSSIVAPGAAQEHLQAAGVCWHAMLRMRAPLPAQSLASCTTDRYKSHADRHHS